MTNFIQRVEGFFIFFFASSIFWLINAEWLPFLLYIFLPDLSMLGYLHNNKTGAFVYNLVHNYALVVLLILLGVLFGEIFLNAGVVLAAHIGIDRALGFGLKEMTGFKHTHLGKIGKK